MANLLKSSMLISLQGVATLCSMCVHVSYLFPGMCEVSTETECKPRSGNCQPTHEIIFTVSNEFGRYTVEIVK